MASLWFRAAGGNWNVAANWSITADLNTPSAAIPTTADDCFLVAGSGNLNLSASGATCRSIDFTGWSGTWSAASTYGLTVVGNVTTPPARMVVLSPTMNITTTNALTVGNGTITSNGKAYSGTLTIDQTGGTVTTTLGDNWTVQIFNLQSGAGDRVLNGAFRMNSLTNITLPQVLRGTATLVAAGTGTISQTAAYCTIPFEINTTGTITFTGTFTTQGRLTYVAGTVITAGATIVIGYGGNNGQQVDFRGLEVDRLNINNAGDVSFLSDVYVTSNLQLAGKDVNGPGIIYNRGNLALITGHTAGNGTVVLIGTGTWTGDFNLGPNLTIDTTGTITISGAVRSTGNFTYVKGTVFTAGSTVMFANAAEKSASTGSIMFNNVVFTNGGILNLVTDLNVDGYIQTLAGKSINGSTIYTRSVTLTTFNLSGTHRLVFNKTGTWTSQGGIVGSQGSTIIDVGAGTLTISDVVELGQYLLKYQSGTVVTTGSTLIIDAVNPSSLDTNGIVWNNVTMGSSSSTMNLISKLTCTGTLTIGNGYSRTVAGAGGFEVGTLVLLAQAGYNFTLQEGVTYRVNTRIDATDTSPSARLLIKSSASILIGTRPTAVAKAILTVAPGATTALGYVNFMDIDASGGRTIYTFNGVVTESFNIVPYSDPVRTTYKSFIAA